jgi:hypothetical protein
MTKTFVGRASLIQCGPLGQGGKKAINELLITGPAFQTRLRDQGGLLAAIRSGESPPALPISDWSLRPLIAKAPPHLAMENMLDRWKVSPGHGTETVPPITLVPPAEKRVSSIEG